MARLFNMDAIKQEYNSSKGWGRELGKWAFALGTFGLGGLYLWGTTTVIREGEIGLRCTARGKMVLLPPGRHSNFPWESYPVEPQSLNQKVINLGPYKIVTVDTGYIAETYNQGKLEILGEGQHLLTEASHVYDNLIPIKQETKKLHEVIAFTSDNVGLTIHADVRYHILDPKIAIEQIDDITTSVAEIATVSIAQIISHHNLADFAPATTGVGTDKRQSEDEHGLGRLLQELTFNITERFASLGIRLLNIGITSWSINDKGLAHELAQGAVVQSQTQSKMICAKRAAEIQEISANADATATMIRAKAEAGAIQIIGHAIEEMTQGFSPAAQAIYGARQQVDLVSHAKNANLFFSTTSGGGGPNFNLPLPNPNTAPTVGMSAG